MSDLIKEEVVATTPTAEAVKPVAKPAPAAPAKASAECTRDTRGEAECAVKKCENCN